MEKREALRQEIHHGGAQTNTHGALSCRSCFGSLAEISFWQSRFFQKLRRMGYYLRNHSPEG